MNPGMLSYVLAQLEVHKGKWREIADATEVPYDTISKIARGAINDPRVSKLERLHNYLKEREVAA